MYMNFYLLSESLKQNITKLLLNLNCLFSKFAVNEDKLSANWGVNGHNKFVCILLFCFQFLAPSC